MPAAVRKVIGNIKQFFFPPRPPLRLERPQKKYIVNVTPKDFRYLSWLGTLQRKIIEITPSSDIRHKRESFDFNLQQPIDF